MINREVCVRSGFRASYRPSSFFFLFSFCCCVISGYIFTKRAGVSKILERCPSFPHATMTNLLDCPPELLVHIFAYLPFTSLRGLLVTSKALNDLITSSVLLQYLLHLQSSSHSLYPSTSTCSLIDQLKVLTDSEKRWQDWEYTTYNRLEIQHRPSGIYDLTSGIFILGEGSTLGRLTIGLRWVDLRLGKDLVWNVIDLQTPIVDLGVNVLEWDLIAVVSMYANLLFFFTIFHRMY